MAEIDVGLQAMYETQIQQRIQHVEKKRYTWLIGVIVIIALLGAVLPSPTSWYVWGVGTLSAYAFYTL